LHGRPAASLFGDRARLWRDFRNMALLAAALGAVGLLLLATIADVRWEKSLTSWALLLPLALPLILLQTGAEEMVFRGYLLQQLGARFGAGALSAWMVAPSLLFVAGHLDPGGQGGNLPVIAGVIFLFALISADITARTGSLGAAWGLHFVNNVLAILFVTLEGPLSGLSLGGLPFAASSSAALPWLLLDGLGLTLVYLLWRWRYGR
ncbi:MAG: CPBP family intramembrane glutamic endopeptidase, partial [Pseudomonadota bacterium]